MVALQIPVEQIAERAQSYDARRFFLVCLAAVPLAIGWTARAVWWVLTLVVAAFMVGWKSGPVGTPGRGRETRR